MSKKQKTVEIGVIKKGQYGPYLSLNGPVKDFQLTVEEEVGGEKVLVKYTLPVNDKGYLNSIFINKPEDKFGFAAKNEWITEEEAQVKISKAAEYGISRYLSAKMDRK